MKETFRQLIALIKQYILMKRIQRAANRLAADIVRLGEFREDILQRIRQTNTMVVEYNNTYGTDFHTLKEI